MGKLDLKKELKEYYKASAKKPAVVDVPEFKFIMVEGEGNPNTSKDFSHCVEALFSVSYKIKFMVKRGEMGIDYAVMPLEGQWFADDMTVFEANKKDDWKWRIMIHQPEFITTEIFEAGRKEAAAKKDLPAAERLKLDTFTEGKAVQILHIGPYSEEAPTIEKLHKYIIDNGWKLSGLHREIYLSDQRRTAPEKLKTIIRQPFKEK